MDFLLAGKGFSLQGQGLAPGLDVQRLYLWRTFRGQAEQRSGVGQKVFGSSSEFVVSFTPEWRSVSSRNRVRVAPEYAPSTRDHSSRLILCEPRLCQDYAFTAGEEGSIIY